MRDIPVFDTQWGVGSLVLNQIPYTATAYIRIQSTQNGKDFLQECISFCRACGAEVIYATGDPVCADYPWHTDILKMQIAAESIPACDALLFPVTEATAKKWQSIYNDKVRFVPNGAWLTEKALEEMLSKGDGYFIHKDGMLLGIGRAGGDRIDWVASVYPRAGKTVVQALTSLLNCETVCLEVASANTKAMHLYESMGFLPSQIISRWYKVYEK